MVFVLLVGIGAYGMKLRGTNSEPKLEFIKYEKVSLPCGFCYAARFRFKNTTGRSVEYQGHPQKSNCTESFAFPSNRPIKSFLNPLNPSVQTLPVATEIEVSVYLWPDQFEPWQAQFSYRASDWRPPELLSFLNLLPQKARDRVDKVMWSSQWKSVRSDPITDAIIKE